MEGPRDIMQAFIVSNQKQNRCRCLRKTLKHANIQDISKKGSTKDNLETNSGALRKKGAGIR